MIKFVQNWIENNISESVRVWIGIIFILVLPGILIYFFAHYEGVASILFLLIGLALAKKNIRDWIIENYKHALIFASVFVVFGSLFDSAGNLIYNIPVKSLCPAETELIREVIIVEGEYHDDNDVYVQIFSCFSYRENRIVEVLSRWKIFAIRFSEYLAICLFFLGFYWLLAKFDKPGKS